MKKIGLVKRMKLLTERFATALCDLSADPAKISKVDKGNSAALKCGNANTKQKTNVLLGCFDVLSYLSPDLRSIKFQQNQLKVPMIYTCAAVFFCRARPSS